MSFPTDPGNVSLEPPTNALYALTLRDWFAGQALAGMMARDTFDEGQATPEQRARLAYIDADAMLKARNAGGAS